MGGEHVFGTSSELVEEFGLALLPTSRSPVAGFGAPPPAPLGEHGAAVVAEDELELDELEVSSWVGGE